jgi:hypothetical protein
MVIILDSSEEWLVNESYAPRSAPGFRDQPEAFEISRYEIDQTNGQRATSWSSTEHPEFMPLRVHAFAEIRLSGGSFAVAVRVLCGLRGSGWCRFGGGDGA